MPHILLRGYVNRAGNTTHVSISQTPTTLQGHHCEQTEEVCVFSLRPAHVVRWRIRGGDLTLSFPYKDTAKECRLKKKKKSAEGEFKISWCVTQELQLKLPFPFFKWERGTKLQPNCSLPVFVTETQCRGQESHLQHHWYFKWVRMCRDLWAKVQMKVAHTPRGLLSLFKQNLSRVKPEDADYPRRLRGGKATRKRDKEAEWHPMRALIGKSHYPLMRVTEKQARQWREMLLRIICHNDILLCQSGQRP